MSEALAVNMRMPQKRKTGCERCIWDSALVYLTKQKSCSCFEIVEDSGKDKVRIPEWWPVLSRALLDTDSGHSSQKGAEEKSLVASMEAWRMDLFGVAERVHLPTASISVQPG